MNRIWRLSILIVTIILVDQFSKGMVQDKFFLGESINIIPGLLNFSYVQNPGAAFGFMAEAGSFLRGFLFIVIPMLACLWLVYLIWTSKEKSFILPLSYSLILAGACGNLLDRFSLGYVVDFIDFFYGKNHFPAFNFADSAISIAAALLILDFFIQLKNELKEEKDPESHVSDSN
ncbi:MAG: signal peptidase II [Halobacteriovoraceae bacterium]|jgi:signal peptidase II|nr:signal peptidase II [Halobacteriovoraceae bacterium]